MSASPPKDPANETANSFAPNSSIGMLSPRTNVSKMIEENAMCNVKSPKRFLLTGVNSLLGQSLFEQLRNDHMCVEQNETPHRFLGTLNKVPAGGLVSPSPSAAIKIVDHKEKPKTFVKQVRNADFVVLDLSQFNADLDEAETVLKALKYADAPCEKD